MGIYNVGSAFTHGFPVSSSASRTALGYLVGARTQMYSLVAMVVVVIIMLTAHSLLANFPTAAPVRWWSTLARLIEVSEFRSGSAGSVPAS